MKPLTIIFACLLCTAIMPVHALSVQPPDQSFLSAFDQNGDGRLTQSEFLAIGKTEGQTGSLRWDFPINRDSFRTLDRNKNGYLEQKDELPIGFSQEIHDYISCWPRPAPCN